MTTTQTTAPKTAKTPKVAPTAIARVTDILKKAALQNKISKEELDQVANLAGALKTGPHLGLAPGLPWACGFWK